MYIVLEFVRGFIEKQQVVNEVSVCLFIIG